MSHPVRISPSNVNDKTQITVIKEGQKNEITNDLENTTETSILSEAATYKNVFSNDNVISYKVKKSYALNLCPFANVLATHCQCEDACCGCLITNPSTSKCMVYALRICPYSEFNNHKCLNCENIQNFV